MIVVIQTLSCYAAAFSAMGQQLTNYLTDRTCPSRLLKEQFKALFRPWTPAEGPLKAVFAKKWRQKASYIIWTCLGICGFAMWLKAFPEAKVFQIGFAPASSGPGRGLHDSFGLCIRSGFLGKFFLKFEEIGQN